MEMIQHFKHRRETCRLPVMNQRNVPTVVEGRQLPYLIQIRQYFQGGAWIFEYDATTLNVTRYLYENDALYPNESVGYPVVFPDHVEFRYYGAEYLRAARQASLAAIPVGFARLREKKMAKVVCRQLPLEVVLGCILPFL